MRRFHQFVPPVALALIAAVSCTFPQIAAAQSRSDSASVLAALRRYQGFILHMESDSIAALYARDGRLLVPGRAAVVGPDSIRAFLRPFNIYRVLGEKMTSTTLAIHGDSAGETGVYWQRVRLPKGDTVEVRGSFAITWVRSRNGPWRIAQLGTTPVRRHTGSH